MLIDQFGVDVFSPEYAHVLDEACVVDAPDIKGLDIRIIDSGGGEDSGAEHCEELTADGLSPLGEEVVAVRHVERFDVGGVPSETIETAEPVEGVVR